MKRIILLASTAAATVLAFGATSASAQQVMTANGVYNPTPTPTPPPAPTPTPPVNNSFSIDMSGFTLGQGQVATVAEGGEKFTQAEVLKSSRLNFGITANGGACEIDCTSFAYSGEAVENISTIGLAQSRGTGSAEAGVANQSVGRVNLNGSISFGNAPMPAQAHPNTSPASTTAQPGR